MDKDKDKDTDKGPKNLLEAVQTVCRYCFGQYTTALADSHTAPFTRIIREVLERPALRRDVGVGRALVLPVVVVVVPAVGLG